MPMCVLALAISTAVRLAYAFSLTGAYFFLDLSPEDEALVQRAKDVDYGELLPAELAALRDLLERDRESLDKPAKSRKSKSQILRRGCERIQSEVSQLFSFPACCALLLFQIQYMSSHADGAALAVVCKASGGLTFEPHWLGTEEACSFVNSKLKMTDFEFETGLEAHVLGQKAAAAAPTSGLNQDFSRGSLKTLARKLLREGLRACFSISAMYFPDNA